LEVWRRELVVELATGEVGITDKGAGRASVLQGVAGGPGWVGACGSDGRNERGCWGAQKLNKSQQET
jgi:hypothetical protein